MVYDYNLKSSTMVGTIIYIQVEWPVNTIYVGKKEEEI